MAIETEAEVRARLAEIAPGAAVSSAGRSVERNAAVGGVPGSLHTRRDADGGSRGLDIVPGTSGLSMAELNTRLANSGLNFQERLNEGDHVHVGVDGRPSVPRQIPASAGPADVRTDANGRQYTVANAQGLAPEDTPESLTAAGYQQAADGTWFRWAPAAPQMLDSAYAERQAARESLALDQEDSEIIQASLVPEGVVNAAGAMAGDMAKGVFMEGAQSIMSGVKRGVNETMDLLDEAADWIETYVPGTLMWEGFDGDGTTPARIFLTTQNDAARRMAEAGKAPSLLSTPGRFTTSEAERPESVTGRVIEGVSQFATGFAGGGRVLRGWKTATKAGRIGKSMVQGALADFTAFDGNEARLSNLLAEHAPDAIAPMFEILAAKEDDPEIVGRFKNAVEGTLLGGAVEVLAGGVRALRAGRVARDEARAGAAREGLQEDPVMSMAEAEAKGVEMQAAVREALGNPEGPRFRVVREAPEGAAARATLDEAAAARPLEGEIVTDGPVAASKATLWEQTPDDLRRMLDEANASDQEKLVMALGEDGAAEFKRLDRARNGTMDTARADAASAEFDARFGNLTPDQERLVYGIGEIDATADDIATVLKAHGDILPDDPAEWAAYMAASSARKIDASDIDAVLNGAGSAEAQAAFVRFQAASDYFTAQGVSAADLPGRMVAALVNQGGWRPDQAAEVIGSFVRGLEARGVKARALEGPAPARPTDAGTRATGAPADPEVITPFQSKVDDAYVATSGTTPRDVTASADNVFDLNLARINTPEDVQAAIVGMADRMAKDVNLARRGVVTDAQAIESAKGMDWVQSMADRRPGQAMNKEEVIAYRMALNSSGTQLVKLAKAVEDNPTLANQFAFRRATSVHAAIQNEFFGARAEAGRALGAFRTEVGTPASYLRNVDSLIADMGGANSAVELARKIRQAAAKGDSELNQMVRGGAMARTREIVKLVYTNALLSGVGTPTINIAGNGMMLGLNLITRAISPRMAGMFGGNATTKVGEAARLLHGYQQAVRDIFRLNPFEAAERIKGTDGRMLPTALREQGVFRGMAPGLDDAAPAGVKLRAEREEAGMASGRPLSAGAWRVNEDSPLGRVLDIMQMVFEAPSNINSLTDDAFKTIAARGELHAQAFRKVTTEGLEGEVARARMAELLTNPTEDMLKAAEFEMHDLTFTRETPGMAAALGDLRRFMDNNPTPIPLGTVVFPFIKTPANLISTGIRYSPLAPFMRRFKEAMAEGGAAAETAKAQMALGTAMYSLFMGMAMDGDLTGAGPGNPGQRDALQRVDENGGTVFQPYSVRINDRWVSYERLDPVGQGMGLVADLADLFKNSDWDSDRNGEVDEVIVHGIMAMSSAFFDKTSLRGVMEIVQAMGDRTGAKGEKMIMSRASGAIPFSSGFRTARRGEDKYLRETHNVVTAMMNTMPGLSDDLPVQRDLWGRERTYQTGLGTTYDAIMPVQTRAAGGSAIDLEILNNGVSVTMPDRSIDVMGESVSLKNRPDIYSEFVRLAGAPAFEHLNAVASGTHPDSEFYYGLTDGPGGGKAEYIKDVVSAYRSDARAQILDTYAVDLQDMAARRTLRREQVRGRE
jgi:hypothetical protein